MSLLRRSFDIAGFRAGLEQLSAEVSRSAILAPFRPICLVSSGGFVSVVYLRNREASQDLDYFLHASRYGDLYDTVRAEIRRLVRNVAERLSYDPEWANDEVTTFVGLLGDASVLFERSMEQNVVLYKNSNLHVYAVKWEWVLARKLKRIQSAQEAKLTTRPEDWKDCLAITKLLYEENTDSTGSWLNREVLALFDNSERESPVLSKTVNDLNKLCIRIYGFQPFPGSFWTFSTQSGQFQYMWEDGVTVPRDQWPVQAGQVSILLLERDERVQFDFDRNLWLTGGEE